MRIDQPVDDVTLALCVRVGVALLDGPVAAEVSRLLTGYRDAIRAPLLAEIYALTAERDALRGKRDASPLPDPRPVIRS